MDWANNTEPKVVKRKAGLSYSSPHISSDGKTQKGTTWKSKYNSDIISSYGLKNVSLDGMNDQGLSIEALWLDETKNPLFDSKNSTKGQYNISNLDFVPFVLDRYKNVNELVQDASKIHVWAEPIQVPGLSKNPRDLLLHYIVHDRSGNSVVIEFINGKMKIYNHSTGVLTNSPSYEWQKTNLRNYIDLTSTSTTDINVGNINLQAISHGNGLEGMPGDFTSPSRYVRAFYLRNMVYNANNALGELAVANRIIKNTAVPLGSTRFKLMPNNSKEFVDYTDWTILKDLQHNTFYLQTANHINYVKYTI